MAKALKKVALVVGAVALVATGVGAAIGGAAFAAATGVSLATVTAIGTVASIASTALNMISPAKPKSVMSGQQTSFKLDPQAGIPYAVGRTYLGGNAVHRDTWGVDNQYNGFVIAWTGGGPIDGIEAFKLDQETITFDGAGNAIGGYKDFMWLRSQTGVCPSSALPSPVAGFPGWGANSKLSGYAASVWIAKFDKKGKKYSAGLGRPGIIGRMVKVYDPRLDSTYPGGSGACRALQEDTYVYSENPWLHALTWALGRWQNGKKVIGVGMAPFQIAMASFVDAANIADLNNWKCGGLVSSVDDKNDVLQLFAQAGGGQCIKMGAKLTAFVEAPRVSIATIRANDLVGEISIAGTQFERTRINGVVPIYRSEAHGWEQVPAAPVRFDDYVAEDGERRTAETEFVLVQQLKQAAELAAYEVLNAREFGPIDTQLKLQWLGIEPGDLVTLDIPEDGLAMQPALALVRGLDWSTGNVAISFRSETAAKHALALGKTTTVPPSPSLTVPDLSVVAAPGVGEWSASAETITAPDGTAVPIIVARGATGNPNASHAVFEYRPDVDPVGAMPPAPTLGDIATDDTGFEFVYEAGGWKRRWIMQATQDAGVTVQEFAAVTPLTDYEIAVSYVVRGVLGDRRIIGPIKTGSQLALPPTDASPTPPLELPEGTLWLAPDGHPYRFGSRPWVGGDGQSWIGADDEPWLGSGYADVQDQLGVLAMEAAEAVTAEVARIASDGWLTAGEKSGLVLSHKAMIENHVALDAKALALGVALTERANATASVNALNAYLSSLAPAWNDTTQDTQASASSITGLWGDAAQKVAVLQAAIQGLPGPTGANGADGVDGIDGTDGKLVEFVWKRAAVAPEAPTGNGIPAGWSDDPPAGTDPLWMSKAKQELDGTLVAGESWSTPIRHDGPPGAEGDDGFTVSPSSQTFTIAATANGAVKSGQFPKTLTFKVLQGSTDLSDDAGTDYAVANSNVTASLGGTNGKVLTIDAMSADAGTSTVTVTRGGTTIATVEVALVKARDGYGGNSISDTTLSVNNDSAYGPTNGGPLTLTVGPNGSVDVSINLPYAATTALAKLAGKVQYRTTPGSGGWTDIGAEEQDAFGAVPGEPSALTFTRSVAAPGAAANWEFQLLIRKYSGAGTASLNGDGNMTVSWRSS